MSAPDLVTAASAILLMALIWPAHAQLADNLMVSGSDRPMAEGVGTYGLKGAGTQGVSGQSQAGGLYSARIPTFTLSKSVPGVIVSDGAGNAKVYNNNVDALGAMAGIMKSGIEQQIQAHNQQKAFQQKSHDIPGNSFVAVQPPQLAPQPSVSQTFYGQPALALTRDSAQEGISAPAGASQAIGRRLLQQQGAGAGGIATSLANMGAQAFGSFANKVVNGVADLASGKGPTITQAADGTLQVLTNNNSGDEVQFQKDGTLTWVNGGNAPGIFSVGPKGVHMEKDNVFNSQAYAAGAPSVTISNDPSTASSSGSQTAYSGTAAAQAPTTSTYQNSQNTQSTQSTNSRTNQAATSSSYSAGSNAPAPVPAANAGYDSSNGNTYSNAPSSSSSSTQAQAPAPAPEASSMAASANTGYTTAPTAAATPMQSAGVEACCGSAPASSSASPPAQANGNTQQATYFQEQQPQTEVTLAPAAAVAAESYVTQALSQLRAQQGHPVTQMDATSLGRRLLKHATL